MLFICVDILLMYNKISSLILNSGKENGWGDVFVAQPDVVKENLAGKIFVLAEIGGKKTVGRKIFDFLIAAINDNYYNDEKILLRDKVEGLKIENIFEAALAKTNKHLIDFLNTEKIKINPAVTSITLGVIYENKLHFSSFGRNRSLLLCRRGDKHEIINVEANAAEAGSPRFPGDNSSAVGDATAKTPKIFSSVISGEIPSHSYFVFTNEALPEYLSGQEMIKIITKLPPITASEQIKNVLSGINVFVPFLGIIIKNTVGLPRHELREEVEETLSAHSSISALNYTEQKTERMLAPAGLISFSKFSRKITETLKNWRPERKNISTDDQHQPSLNLGTIKNLKLARADSFSIKEKIFLKRGTGRLAAGVTGIGRAIKRLFQTQFWSGSRENFKTWLKGLNLKNRFLFVALGSFLIIFAVSIIFTGWNQRRQIAQTDFNNLVAEIESKENLIDSHLLYEDNEGARTVLKDAQDLLASLPGKSKDQQATYNRLAEKLHGQEEKIQKIVRVTPEEINNLNGLGVGNLTVADSQIYAAGNASVYLLTPNSASSTKIEIDGARNLSAAHKDYYKDLVHYWDAGNIAELNFKTKADSLISTANLEAAAELTGFQIYNSKLYSLAPSKNQIYVYLDKNGFNTKTDWLKDGVDLSRATDLGIDGDIYVLQADGAVLKFSVGKSLTYGAAPLSPTMTSAEKLIVGNDYLYIFEAASKRLAVLSKKDGHLIKQYVADSLAQPQDVAVDEKKKMAYFLDGEKLYQVSLNQ
ncbi:MAG: hypothetical protein UV95_C0003G0018 [Candidatus Falkowbacteria bacterium GW2011_GWF2_43_32]|nr:MAG: hypothetical protein UV95_C0003G0018 [Candidatus Falkowbacteria bacterium GW2011_GWF2_43_32]